MNVTACRSLAGVTFDLTGTLFGYRGKLGSLYCAGATRVGEACPQDYEAVERGFARAYARMSETHPAFGHAEGMSDKAWWREVVRQSFAAAGVVYHDAWRFERVFGRIYQSFGSRRAYRAFPDAHRILRALRGRCVVGAVSNASVRYRDGILPMLALDVPLDFVLLSGVVGVSKPDARIFRMAVDAVEASANGWEVCETSCAGAAAVRTLHLAEGAPNQLPPREVDPADLLHVGDSLAKDCEPASALGMRVALIDRFGSPDAAEARRRGIPVFRDLDELGRYVVSAGWLNLEAYTSTAAAPRFLPFPGT